MARLGSLMLLIFAYIGMRALHSCSADTFISAMQQGEQLSDVASDHLVSDNGFYKLGFFSPGSAGVLGATKNRFLGIWYSKLPSHPDAIWVGNPQAPINDSSAVFMLDSDGNMKIVYDGGDVNVSDVNKTGSGNVTTYFTWHWKSCVERSGTRWSSWKCFVGKFQQCIKLLPGMKLGRNLKTNTSLDVFLFDSIRGKLLDWEKRVNIIEGIAQGLLYLHKYSRVRVIHRDLKPSNTLLDGNMKPKISDFGMARIFTQNESRANTNRVVGTYGYMSPEYAMNGIFSEKSDVYSFGVLLLEIVSGKKNTMFVSSNALSLIELAWNLWKQGDTRDLADPTLDSCPKDQVSKFVHVGLLCVQEHTMDRPTMSEVISMLTSDIMFLPDPNKPAYNISRCEASLSLPDGRSDMGSINGVSITMVDAR